MSSSGEECTVKIYADGTPAEAIAHEFSVLQYHITTDRLPMLPQIFNGFFCANRTLYAGRDDSPLVGISFRPGQLPWLIFRKCLVRVCVCGGASAVCVCRSRLTHRCAPCY